MTIVKVNARSFWEQCAFTMTNVRLLCQFTKIIENQLRYSVKFFWFDKKNGHDAFFITIPRKESEIIKRIICQYVDDSYERR